MIQRAAGALSPKGAANLDQGRGVLRFSIFIGLGFALLYLCTRTSILIGDAGSFISVAAAGDPAHIHYGEPSHFLQVPLARAVWLALGSLGLPVSLDVVFVAISLAGTLAAVVYVGLIAREILKTPAVAWLASILFGTSLHSMTQWNGELYGLALGFVCAAVYGALRGRVILPAVLWALAVLSHSEFALAAPAVVMAVWLSGDRGVSMRNTLTRASAVLVLAGACTVVVLLAGSWGLGKWTDGTSLIAWLTHSYSAREQDVADSPEVFRAIKGLMTAYSVAGHYWRDILTGRGQFGAPGFVPAAGVGLLVLGFTGVLMVAGARQRRLSLFAILWLVPFHTMVNWWFVPAVEKYHAGALPGLVLLVTAGAVGVGARMPARWGRVLLAGYVAAYAGLNLFGVVLPMRALGERTTEVARDIRQLHAESDGRAVFIACDDPKAIRAAGVPLHRLRSVWVGTVQDIQGSLVAWTTARLSEGREPYLVGRWCLPEEWRTLATKEPFDLHFLESSFRFVPTPLVGIPVTESVPTNPFQWVRGDIVRLEVRSARRD
jgi:hypothetical protein